MQRRYQNIEVNIPRSLYIIVFFIFLFLFFSHSFFSQITSETEVSSNVLGLLRNISSNDTVKVNQDRTFENNYVIQLGRESTKDELIFLTNHKNPLVRFYSFYFLTQNNNDVPYLNIAKNHINDTTSIKIVNWIHGSHGPRRQEIYSEKISDLYIQLIGSNHSGIKISVEMRTFKYQPYLSTQDLGSEKIDSLILCEPNNLKQKRLLYTSTNPLMECYDCVRKDIIENKNHNAILLLAAYQNTDDIDLILQNLDSGSPQEIRKKFYAFSKFQNPRLFEYLENNVSKYAHIPSYLRAVAGYKNVDALNILEVVFEIPKDNVRRSYLKHAVQQHFTEIYASLLFKILEEELSPYFHFPDELWVYDKERTFQLVIDSMEKELQSRHGDKRRPRMIKRIKEILRDNAPELMPRFNELINE